MVVSPKDSRDGRECLEIVQVRTLIIESENRVFTSVSIPLLASHEVPCVVQDQFLDTRIEDDGSERSLWPGSDMPPVTRKSIASECQKIRHHMLVKAGSPLIHEYVDLILSCRHVSFLCLEDQGVEDSTITGTKPKDFNLQFRTHQRK